MTAGVHLNLDNAWEPGALALPMLGAREWGPRLRFCAPAKLVEEFFDEAQSQLAPFVLYGSGDFHYLTALWLRRVKERVVIVSFDNHPDWDVRPPRWACGGWVNRAIELPQVQSVSVWGCGNFECWWPGQLFGNRAAERAGRIDVHPWADARPPRNQHRRGAILENNWRAMFQTFAAQLSTSHVYVTVDLDCLRGSEAATNWENGRLGAADVAWAIRELRQHARVVGGDICGAFSPPKYARRGQRFVAEFDHPKLDLPNEQKARAMNLAAAAEIWPALTEGDADDARRDQ